MTNIGTTRATTRRQTATARTRQNTLPVLRVRMMGSTKDWEGTHAELVDQLRENGWPTENILGKTDYMGRVSERCRMFNDAVIRSEDGPVTFIRDLARWGYVTILDVLDGDPDEEMPQRP